MCALVRDELHNNDMQLRAPRAAADSATLGLLGRTIMCNRWQLLVVTCVFASMAMPRPLLAQASADVERNRQLITRHIELMNSGKWRDAAEMYSPEVRHHLGNWLESGGERIVQGKDVMVENLDDIFRTFPDWKMEIVDMVADSASVIVRCRVSGTHKGIGTRRINGGFLMGVKPTGKHFEVQHIHWYKIHDGKIVDHFANRDDLGMTQQLGLLPRPASPTPRGK
jgi:steroid delta-isomerase-like uncharacterized protein